MIKNFLIFVIVTLASFSHSIECNKKIYTYNYHLNSDEHHDFLFNNQIRKKTIKNRKNFINTEYGNLLIIFLNISLLIVGIRNKKFVISVQNSVGLVNLTVKDLVLCFLFCTIVFILWILFSMFLLKIFGASIACALLSMLKLDLEFGPVNHDPSLSIIRR